MLTNEQKLDIMKQAFQEGYDGLMTDLFAQADPEEAIDVPNTPNPPAPAQPTAENLSLANNPAPSNFMPAQEIPNSQSLVRSYESAKLGETPKGANIPLQLEDPNTYEKGGFRANNIIDFKPDIKDFINPRTHIKNYRRKYEEGGEGNHLEKVEYIYNKRKQYQNGGPNGKEAVLRLGKFNNPYNIEYYDEEGVPHFSAVPGTQKYRDLYEDQMLDQVDLVDEDPVKAYARYRTANQNPIHRFLGMDPAEDWMGINWERSEQNPHYNTRQYLTNPVARAVMDATGQQPGSAPFGYDSWGQLIADTPYLFGAIPGAAAIGKYGPTALGAAAKALGTSIPGTGGAVTIGGAANVAGGAYSAYNMPESIKKFAEDPGWGTGLNLGLNTLGLGVGAYQGAKYGNQLYNATFKPTVTHLGSNIKGTVPNYFQRLMGNMGEVGGIGHKAGYIRGELTRHNYLNPFKPTHYTFPNLVTVPSKGISRTDAGRGIKYLESLIPKGGILQASSGKGGSLSLDSYSLMANPGRIRGVNPRYTNITKPSDYINVNKEAVHHLGKTNVNTKLETQFKNILNRFGMKSDNLPINPDFRGGSWVGNRWQPSDFSHFQVPNIRLRKNFEEGGMAPLSRYIENEPTIPSPNVHKDPLEFAEYYYKSPKHKERLEKRDYSSEEIAQRSEFLSGYGLSKGPKIINRSRNQGSRAYPRKNKIVMDPTYDKKQDPNITYDEVLAHELGHLSTGYRPLKKKDIKEIVDRQGLYEIPKEKEQRFSSEIKSDLDSIRFMLFNAGIYDAGTEDFNWYDLNNAKEELKKSPTFKRIMDTYEDQDFIWLMNNIAMENMETGEGVALHKVKFGGKRKKYPHGGPHNEDGSYVPQTQIVDETDRLNELTNTPVEQMSDNDLRAYVYLMGHYEDYGGEFDNQVFQHELDKMTPYMDEKYGEGRWEFRQSPYTYRGLYGGDGKLMTDFVENFPENFGTDTDLILMGHNTGSEFMHTPWSDVGNYAEDEHIATTPEIDTWAEGFGEVLPENYAGTCFMGTCSPSADSGSYAPSGESNIESMLNQLAQGRTDLGGMNVFGANEMWWGPKTYRKAYPVSNIPGGGLTDTGFADMMYDPRNISGGITSPYDVYNIDYGEPSETYWWREDEATTPFDINIQRRNPNVHDQFQRYGGRRLRRKRRK